MMHIVMSAVSAPLPAFARAAAFAVLAMAAIGTVQLWHHAASANLSEPAATAIDAAQPLAPAPMSVDMWRF